MLDMGYEDDELLEFIRLKAKELGKTPRSQDMNSDDRVPTVKTFHRRFGSWNEALEAAGLEPNSRGIAKKSLEAFRKDVEGDA